jgi:hypothetical protein
LRCVVYCWPLKLRPPDGEMIKVIDLGLDT